MLIVGGLRSLLCSVIDTTRKSACGSEMTGVDLKAFFLTYVIVRQACLLDGKQWKSSKGGGVLLRSGGSVEEWGFLY